MKHFWILALVTCIVVSIGLTGSPVLAEENGLQNVVLASFEATAETNSIRLTWETATELGLLGFNLYREESVDHVVQLNTNLIPSQTPPGSPAGAQYEWIDAIAPDTYDYWLETVDVNGGVRRFGPVSTSFPTPDPVTLDIARAGNGTIRPSEGTHTYTSGTQVTLVARPAPGWTFTGWSGDIQSEAARLDITVDSNMNVIANFEPQQDLSQTRRSH